MNKQVIAVYGGCDPVHIGHVRMIRDAARYGDVMVIINSDEWLERKKGYVFRSEAHTSELQSRLHLVCRRLPEQTNEGS